MKTALQLVADMFRPQMEEKHLVFEEMFAIPEEEVHVDETRFRRVMGNVLGNAVKFTPSGGRIRLSARQTQGSSSSDVCYEFEIADTGIGMSEEFIPRMFQAFEREESSTKSGEAGTGLGLTITKKLLDMMGGSIAVKSKKGEGTIVTIGLPVQAAADRAATQMHAAADRAATQRHAAADGAATQTNEAADGAATQMNEAADKAATQMHETADRAAMQMQAAADKTAAQENAAGGQTAVFGKDAKEHRILLVEDIEINRMLAENILMEAGFLIESVADGSEAVEVIRTKPVWYYDLILMDIQMPVMNGYEATRVIRAMEREDAPHIPIIALSANAREEDKRMSIESGMNSHVAKPFDIAQLISTINHHIASSKERI